MISSLGEEDDLRPDGGSHPSPGGLAETAVKSNDIKVGQEICDNCCLFCDSPDNCKQACDCDDCDCESRVNWSNDNDQYDECSTCSSSPPPPDPMSPGQVSAYISFYLRRSLHLGEFIMGMLGRGVMIMVVDGRHPGFLVTHK